MSHTEVAIYGSGGFGRETAWLVDTCRQAGHLVRQVCFIDDNEENHGRQLLGVPIMSLQGARQAFAQAKVVVAVGNPHTRKLLVEKVKSVGFGFQTLIHPRTELSDSVAIGQGSVICAGSVLTTNIALGEQIQFSPSCTIGHDVLMGEYCTLAPGVHVAGFVHFGARVYVGIGAVIINGCESSPLLIGDDAIIGAGACVTKPVAPKTTVVGVPARPIKR